MFINKANEKWIIDRLRDEWIRNHNPFTRFYKSANMLWIIAPWKWDNTKLEKNSSRKVVCSVYHIDEEKFKLGEHDKIFEFTKEYTNLYHVLCKSTKNLLEKLNHNIEIKLIPLWVNDKVFKSIDNKNFLKKRFNLSNNTFLVGSFQKDTEGRK